MKLFKIASIAAVATLALAAQATAAEFVPSSPTGPTSFTGIGATNMIKGLGPFPCSAKFTGHTDATPSTYAWIDSAAFTGSVFCTSVTAASLPWRAHIVNGTTAVIEQVKFNSPVGPCGPADLTVNLASGAISFHQTLNPGGCEVWTTTPIATTPSVGIIYP
jgi:hypothetical protein